MREFLLSIIGVVVLGLLVEVICPVKKMKNSVALSFSLVVILLLVGGVRSIFVSSEKFQFDEYSIHIENMGEGMMAESVKQIELQIEKAIVAEGGEIRSVEIDFYINELKTKICRVEIYMLSGEMGESEVKEIVKSILDLGEEDIWVRY